MIGPVSAPPHSCDLNGLRVRPFALFELVLAFRASLRMVYVAWPWKALVPDLVLIAITPWPRPYPALTLVLSVWISAACACTSTLVSTLLTLRVASTRAV